MLNHRKLLSSLSVAALAVALVGCASPGHHHSGNAYPPQNPNNYPNNYPSNPGHASFGRVANVEYLRGGQTSGVAGAVIGGAVGGLAGNQVGGGSGRALATVAGVVGGALIGRSIEQNNNRNNADYYRVTVQFDDGGTRAFDYAQPPNVQVGDRVRAEGSQLYR